MYQDEYPLMPSPIKVSHYTIFTPDPEEPFASGFIQLLKAIETVTRNAHHLAGLGDVAQHPR
jgi:hypothetical protein